MGYNMPKGTNIFVNVFAISRDPKYWDNPEEYKPESFENSNVEYYGTHFEFTPFGAMRRQCPGILFAMSTVEITLANLLYHLESICARPGVVCVAEFELAGNTRGCSCGRRRLCAGKPRALSLSCFFLVSGDRRGSVSRLGTNNWYHELVYLGRRSPYRRCAGGGGVRRLLRDAPGRVSVYGGARHSEEAVVVVAAQ